ncbi:Lipoprotein [uncultured Thiomicrorhabdus sp.]
MKLRIASKFYFSVLLLLSAVFALQGCSKEPVKIVSAQMVDNLDRGSGNFDRVFQLCLDKPLTSNYYHRVVLISKENVKIEGDGLLRPMASDPDNPCYLRNIYLYINKDSPVDARALIKDYMVPGNVRQLLVQIYNEKPQGKELPIAEKVFNNL